MIWKIGEIPPDAEVIEITVDEPDELGNETECTVENITDKELRRFEKWLS